MPVCKSTYEPREDSILLERYVRQYAKGDVLDMGTGSGIQTITAAHNNKVKSVIALDIQKSAIEYCKKNIINNKIKFFVSDLFETFEKNKLRRRFDTIIFNPPYLPSEVKIKDLTIQGGKKGYETLEKFFNMVNSFLKINGIILIVFSSLTKKAKVDEFIKKNLLEFKLLERQHIFFEDLYVYLTKKSEVLKKLEKKQIKNIKYFASGKRGMVFTGLCNNKKAAIKTKNPESKAALRIDSEINFLKILNKKNIGPRLLFYDKDFFVYEFVDGIPIIDFIENISINKNNKKIISKIIIDIIEQLHIMDRLGINKEEMSHPEKHILINNKNKPVLIDFERCHFTIKPSNVTQFCDFLISKRVLRLLKNSRIEINKSKIIALAKEYKRNINKKCLNKIIDEIKCRQNSKTKSMRYAKKSLKER